MKHKLVNEIVRIIIFKRKIRYYYNKLCKIFYILIAILTISMILVYKSKVQILYEYTVNKTLLLIENIYNIFTNNNINQITFIISGNKNVKTQEIYEIIKSLKISNVNNKSIKNIIEALENIDIIKNVYIKKNTTNNNITINIVEKQIIAILKTYEEHCTESHAEYCTKSLVTSLVCEDDTIIPFREIENANNFISVIDHPMENSIATFINQLKENQLYDYVTAIRPFASNRWNIEFANGLLIKLPRENHIKALQYIKELDTKYNILAKDVKIKYIDLRIENKIYIGE